jgi:hypothetical protein
MVDREESRLTHGARLHFFDRLFVDTAATPIGRNALRGWVGFVETCVVDWVESPALSREELTELFVNTFQRVVAPAVPTRALSIPG